jgi:hypothetical protein
MEHYKRLHSCNGAIDHNTIFNFNDAYVYEIVQ